MFFCFRDVVFDSRDLFGGCFFLVLQICEEGMSLINEGNANGGSDNIGISYWEPIKDD